MTYRIDAAKWVSSSLAEQMGNIYSEVGRSLSAKKRGDVERANNSMGRAIDLFNETVRAQLDSPLSYRSKEVLRARDQYLSVYMSANADDPALDSYFLHFAILARKDK